MSFIVIISLFSLVIFLASFITKRRFGMLGFALAAGVMLSELLVGEITPIVSGAGIILVKPPLESVVMVCITMLPSILLIMTGGPVYKSKLYNAIGSLAYVILSVSLLIEAFGRSLLTDNISVLVYSFISRYSSVMIVACLAYALVDLVLTRHIRDHKASKH